MSALTVQQDEAALVPVLRSSLYPGASDDSIRLVMTYCQRAGFDVMLKPVHIVPMWDRGSGSMRDVVMPGIGLYRTIAARSGCAGVSEPEFGPDKTEAIGGKSVTYPTWCKVTVSRRLPTGEIAEFTAKEFWLENYAMQGGKEKSVAPNAMWLKRPFAQLAKCAEAQALRKGFPEVGAAPTAEELEGKPHAFAGETIDADTGEVTRKAPPAKPLADRDQFEAKLPRWREQVQAGATVANLLAMLQSKYTLSPEQIEAINSLKSEQAIEIEQTQGDQS